MFIYPDIYTAYISKCIAKTIVFRFFQNDLLRDLEQSGAEEFSANNATTTQYITHIKQTDATDVLFFHPKKENNHASCYKP